MSKKKIDRWLEDLALPARLASTSDSPGCFTGSLASMLQQVNFDVFLDQKTSIVAIGSEELLTTTKKLFTGVTNKQFYISFNY